MPDHEPESKSFAFPKVSRELRLRCASAAVVGLGSLAVLYWGRQPFAVLLTGLTAAMAWEWGRIVRGVDADRITAIHAGSTVLAIALASIDMTGLALAVVAIGAAAAFAMSDGAAPPALTAVGVFYTGLPAIALEWLRSDASLGFLAVLFIILVVAATDTAAYASGRTIGGPKLWPAVSPNKTWAGLIGGAAAATVVGAVFPALSGSGEAPWLAVLGLVLGLTAQAGDLAESALKRRFGVKDSSNLIPGHGGFMDRFDGLVAAAVVSGIVALVIEAGVPARALLYGD